MGELDKNGRVGSRGGAYKTWAIRAKMEGYVAGVEF